MTSVGKFGSRCESGINNFCCLIIILTFLDSNNTEYYCDNESNVSFPVFDSRDETDHIDNVNMEDQEREYERVKID